MGIYNSYDFPNVVTETKFLNSNPEGSPLAGLKPTQKGVFGFREMYIALGAVVVGNPCVKHLGFHICNPKA